MAVPSTLRPSLDGGDPPAELSPSMHARWIRLARVAITFAVVGWLAGALVLTTNSDQDTVGAFVHPIAFRSGLAALLASLAWGPALAWTRLRWIWGAIIGVPIGLTAIYVFFFIWPHGWQAGRVNAWKSVTLFTTIYWRYLIPMSCLAGALSSVWAKRTVRPPRWVEIADED